MEALCKNVRKLSVASAAIKNAEKDSIEAFASSTAGGVTRPSFFCVNLILRGWNISFYKARRTPVRRSSRNVYRRWLKKSQKQMSDPPNNDDGRWGK